MDPHQNGCSKQIVLHLACIYSRLTAFDLHAHILIWLDLADDLSFDTTRSLTAVARKLPSLLDIDLEHSAENGPYSESSHNRHDIWFELPGLMLE